MKSFIAIVLMIHLALMSAGGLPSFGQGCDSLAATQASAPHCPCCEPSHCDCAQSDEKGAPTPAAPGPPSRVGDDQLSPRGLPSELFTALFQPRYLSEAKVARAQESDLLSHRYAVPLRIWHCSLLT